MSRIRTVKPEFWTDDLIGSLPRDARLLFIGSWNLADDEGRLRWSAPYLKGAVFPFDDDVLLPEVESMMIALQDAGLVIPYVGGRSQQRLGFIRNFAKHQRINRPQPSKLPAPPHAAIMDQGTHRSDVNSVNDAVNDADGSSRNDVDTPSVLEGEEEREQEEEDLSLRSRSARGPEAGNVGPIPFVKGKLRRSDFPEFWSAYPHKVGKGAAEKEFEKVVSSKSVDLDVLLVGIGLYKKTKPPDRSWCNPATWLHQKRWLDETEPPMTSKWAQTA